MRNLVVGGVYDSIGFEPLPAHADPPLGTGSSAAKIVPRSLWIRKRAAERVDPVGDADEAVTASVDVADAVVAHLASSASPALRSTSPDARVVSRLRPRRAVQSRSGVRLDSTRSSGVAASRRRRSRPADGTCFGGAFMPSCCATWALISSSAPS
jgi:hypothetical protein